MFSMENRGNQRSSNLKEQVNTVDCPGCKNSYNNSEDCKKHLLEVCIRFNTSSGRQINTIRQRQEFIQLIHKIFKADQECRPYSLRPRNPCRNAFTKHVEGSAMLVLTNIRKMYCCPICQDPFREENILNHLFGSNCLYVDKSLKTVKRWLIQFFNLRIGRTVYSLSPSPPEGRSQGHFPSLDTLHLELQNTRTSTNISVTTDLSGIDGADSKSDDSILDLNHATSPISGIESESHVQEYRIHQLLNNSDVENTSEITLHLSSTNENKTMEFINTNDSLNVSLMSDIEPESDNSGYEFSNTQASAKTSDKTNLSDARAANETELRTDDILDVSNPISEQLLRIECESHLHENRIHQLLNNSDIENTSEITLHLSSTDENKTMEFINTNNPLTVSLMSDMESESLDNSGDEFSNTQTSAKISEKTNLPEAKAANGTEPKTVGILDVRNPISELLGVEFESHLQENRVQSLNNADVENILEEADVHFQRDLYIQFANNADDTNLPSPEEVESTAFTCFICNHEYAKSDEYKEHIFQKHVRCLCDRDKKLVFSRFCRLQRHLSCCKNTHIRCPICSSLFVFQTEEEFDHHILNCNPSSVQFLVEEQLSAIGDIYPYCFLCDPVSRILITELQSHFRIYHS